MEKLTPPLENLNPGFISVPRKLSNGGSSLFPCGIVRFGFVLAILDVLHSGATLVARTAGLFGFVFFVFGFAHLRLATLLRRFLRPGHPLLVLGLVRLSVLLAARASAALGPVSSAFGNSGNPPD